MEGYPRVGANRELKTALESFWAGRIDEETFVSSAHSIRVENYARLRDLGLDQDYAIPADVALYDQVLETAVTVGLIGGDAAEIDLTEYFALARGNAQRSPLEMTKWFDTNYHYLVPEVSENTVITPRPQRILDIVTEAKNAGHVVRPFLVGPVTLLAKSKATEDAGEGFNPLTRLADLTAAYKQVLAALKEAGVEWIQLAEPALVADLTIASDQELADHAATVYGEILGEENRPQVLITTPYGALRAGLDALVGAKPEALAVDLAPVTLNNEEGYVARVAKAVAGTGITLAAGVIDGRNIWAADLRERLSVLEELKDGGVEKLAVTSSVSLQHVPHTVSVEKNLPVDVAGWLSFADEKIGEAQALAAALEGGTVAAADAFARSDRAVRTRRESARTHNQAVQDRVAALPDGQVAREPEFEGRVEAQKVLNLPKLPTTTIGSFPQTTEIRKARADHRSGALTDEQYTDALKDEVKSVIELQERLGIDVLVHGEPERNDM
ncbi:MAG: 5-methyltetrahydropteroyltriglutamate--homocysteine S-methyltransferase, partial [Corynebacterium humireducens]|nr:5-methyltetrahydropteroyltriglutamate--homocysteine S-methyltransferase [Corynebacterium humireducens]